MYYTICPFVSRNDVSMYDRWNQTNRTEKSPDDEHDARARRKYSSRNEIRRFLLFLFFHSFSLSRLLVCAGSASASACHKLNELESNASKSWLYVRLL